MRCPYGSSASNMFESFETFGKTPAIDYSDDYDFNDCIVNKRYQYDSFSC